MTQRVAEDADYLSAASSVAAEGSSSEDGYASDASVSSVDSQELRALLEELEIVQPRKRPLQPSLGTSPSTQRPFTSPRLERGSRRAPAAPAAPVAAVLPPPPARPAAAPTAAAAAAEPEVVELLDSSSESEGEDEEEWRIAAPATGRKSRQRVLDSDEEDDEDDESSGSSGAESEEVDEEDGPALAERSAELPPYFAAIPALSTAAAAAAVAAPAAAPPRRPQQPSQQQPQPRPGGQQTAAPPPPRSTSTASQGSLGSAGSDRPMSATAFRRQREALTAELFREFNRTVFEGRLPGDLQIKWNARLLTTAGLTHYRRDIPDDPYAPPIYSARVELSSKVLDSFAKLERTLCHELCHVAAWLLDHTAKPPHGPVFRRWAARAMGRYAHLDITTCHAYEIFYPFRWQCSNAGCATEYGRHSNSIDITKKVCGKCRAPLTFLGKFKPDGTPAKQRGTNKFAEFVKQNAAEIKRQLPAGTPHKEVMQRVAGMYAAARDAQRQQAAAQQQPAAGSGGSGGTIISLLAD